MTVETVLIADKLIQDKEYQATNSSFHFSLDKPFPFELIGKTVREIVEKVNLSICEN